MAEEMTLPRAARIATAAKALGVAPGTIKNWARQGLIRTTKVGGCVLVSVADLERLTDPIARDPAAGDVGDVAVSPNF